MGNNKPFDQIKIGDTAEFDIVIDDSLHNAFSTMVQDHSSIHVDDSFAKKNKFSKKIGYAFLLTSFLSQLYGEHLPGGSSICLKQESNFIKPYYIGEAITIKAEVIEKVKSTRLVTIKTTMLSGKDIIFKGNGIVKVLF